MAFLDEPTKEDVSNRVVHDFSPHVRERVFAILSGAKAPMRISWQQLAALRAAAGNFDRLQQWIDLGNRDWRDLKLAMEGIAGADWERSFILYEERAN